MPVALEKAGAGYKVKNLETGKEYSKKPLPKKRAEAQLRVLQTIMKKERKK
jgi:hypothetical protein